MGSGVAARGGHRHSSRGTSRVHNLCLACLLAVSVWCIVIVEAAEEDSAADKEDKSRRRRKKETLKTLSEFTQGHTDTNQSRPCGLYGKKDKRTIHDFKIVTISGKPLGKKALRKSGFFFGRIDSWLSAEEQGDDMLEQNKTRRVLPLGFTDQELKGDGGDRMLLRKMKEMNDETPFVLLHPRTPKDRTLEEVFEWMWYSCFGTKTTFDEAKLWKYLIGLDGKPYRIFGQYFPMAVMEDTIRNMIGLETTHVFKSEL
eukprot:gnl/TRDRNA2_/TRDRNA2_133414_c0_seq2.p1 gnl/TRDRNA2_/TRDRNA2_133414_c0~~gnl/TRDRNA2_/TRDRNA2_133414_c0_seq2.p1  ORF type:complete len:265 (-),score=40.37 gnl/TRDRNA2_/TRDRNA2_133414_c0_seq2:41-811(-)